jgi:hypothetical protein
MLDILMGPVFAFAYGALLLAIFAVSVVRLNRGFRAAEEFLRKTGEWTLQVRNENGFRLYRKNVADEALARGGLSSAWSEFLDEIHIRYNDEGHPLAESSTDALEKVKHDLREVFERSHKVTRLTSVALAVFGLLGAVFAVGVGALSAAPFLQQDPADAARALAALFSAGGLAFVASATGLLGAIVFRAIERWQSMRIERRIDALANHLRSFVSFRGEPYFLAELAYTLRSERAGVKEFGQELLERLSKPAQEGAQSVVAAVEALTSTTREQTDILLQANSSQTLALVHASGEQGEKVAAAVLGQGDKNLSALAHHADVLASTLSEQTEALARAVSSQTEAITHAVLAPRDSHAGESVVLARNQLEALRSLENAVQGLEIQVVSALGRVGEAVTQGETRVSGAFRVAVDDLGRDVRQALDRLGTQFGSAVHVSAGDLGKSLASLSESLARDLSGVHAIHYAEATLLARARPPTEAERAGQAHVNPPSPASTYTSMPMPTGGSLVINETQGPLAEFIDAEPTVVSVREDLAFSPALALADIPPTLQVMVGCLDLLQSGLRGLGTVRAQLSHLRETVERQRRLLGDIQAAALPVSDDGSLPAWWNARATRVVDSLARVDTLLAETREAAQGYDSSTEALLAEAFVRLGKNVERVWDGDRELPAIVENLWGGSRTPSQLVKSVAALKEHLAALCRALLGAQRNALTLERALVEVWECARSGLHTDEAYWRALEEKALLAGRRGRVVGAARKRIAFPALQLDAEVVPALTSLGNLIEETGLCLESPSVKKGLHDKLPKVG